MVQTFLLLPYFFIFRIVIILHKIKLYVFKQNSAFHSLLPIVNNGSYIVNEEEECALAPGPLCGSSSPFLGL